MLFLMLRSLYHDVKYIFVAIMNQKFNADDDNMDLQNS